MALENKGKQHAKDAKDEQNNARGDESELPVVGEGDHNRCDNRRDELDEDAELLGYSQLQHVCRGSDGACSGARGHRVQDMDGLAE